MAIAPRKLDLNYILCFPSLNWGSENSDSSNTGFSVSTNEIEPPPNFILTRNSFFPFSFCFLFLYNWGFCAEAFESHDQKLILPKELGPPPNAKPQSKAQKRKGPTSLIPAASKSQPFVVSQAPDWWPSRTRDRRILRMKGTDFALSHSPIMRTVWFPGWRPN